MQVVAQRRLSQLGVLVEQRQGLAVIAHSRLIGLALDGVLGRLAQRLQGLLRIAGPQGVPGQPIGHLLGRVQLIQHINNALVTLLARFWRERLVDRLAHGIGGEAVHLNAGPLADLQNVLADGALHQAHGRLTIPPAHFQQHIHFQPLAQRRRPLQQLQQVAIQAPEMAAGSLQDPGRQRQILQVNLPLDAIVMQQVFFHQALHHALDEGRVAAGLSHQARQQAGRQRRAGGIFRAEHRAHKDLDVVLVERLQAKHLAGVIWAGGARQHALQRVSLADLIIPV